jgi:hypothetical protein
MQINATFPAIDVKLQGSAAQTPKPQQGQSRDGRRALRINRNTRIKLDTECRQSCENVPLSSLIPVNPDIRSQQRDAATSNSD